MFQEYNLIKAADPQAIAMIVSQTILEVYPKYYPAGAVRFFLDLHREEHIREAMENKREEIWLFLVNGESAGTGSIRGNEICRLFIYPAFQNKGYGSKMMEFLEQEVFLHHPTVHIDASFPAESMYLKRGYQIVSYEKIRTDNGDFLCYHTMEKKRMDWEGNTFPTGGK